MKWRELLGASFILVSPVLGYLTARQPYAEALSNLRWAFWTLLAAPALLGIQLVVYRIVSGVRWANMGPAYVVIPFFALWTAGLLVRTLDQTATQIRVAEYSSTVLEVRGGKRPEIVLAPFANSTSPVSVLQSEARLFNPPIGTRVRIIDEAGPLGIGTRQFIRADEAL
ncbi:MAG TPA: hypothetical protein VFQ61_26435 [Polyangiaceae bacterium]|nr:hypothetical protein [Polyangiaceae bacterium]